MVLSGSENGGTVPYKAIEIGGISPEPPYKSLTDGRYLHFRILEFPASEIGHYIGASG